MIDEQPPESTLRWWPGRTSAIISATLVVLACPVLAYAIVFLLGAVFIRIPVGKPGFQRNEDTGLAIAVGYIFGSIALAIAGVLLMGAAGLYLRPGFRGRAMLIIAGLIVLLPVVAVLARVVLR